MDFGSARAPAPDAWTFVPRAETLGFSHAWLYDTRLLCADVFVAMALELVRLSTFTCALVPIGWPRGRYARPERRPVDTWLFWERYGPPRGG